MAKLLKVCLDSKGNDRDLAVTKVAADSSDEAIEKLKIMSALQARILSRD